MKKNFLLLFSSYKFLFLRAHGVVTVRDDGVRVVKYHACVNPNEFVQEQARKRD